MPINSQSRTIVIAYCIILSLFVGSTTCFRIGSFGNIWKYGPREDLGLHAVPQNDVSNMRVAIISSSQSTASNIEQACIKVANNTSSLIIFYFFFNSYFAYFVQPGYDKYFEKLEYSKSKYLPYSIFVSFRSSFYLQLVFIFQNV